MEVRFGVDVPEEPSCNVACLLVEFILKVSASL